MDDPVHGMDILTLRISQGITFSHGDHGGTETTKINQELSL